MTEKAKSRSAKKSGRSTIPSQLRALNPMVGVVGMAGWVEMVKESSQFFPERLEKDLEAQRELLKCKSVEDLLRFQSNFYRDAFEQYTAEYQRLAQLWSRSMSAGLREATVPSARNYDDIPL